MKKQIRVGLFLLVFLAAAPAFAQEEEEQQQQQQAAAKPEIKQISEERYKAFCKPDFAGEPISMNAVNADIRDILNYINKQYGYDFVLGDSIGRVVSSVNFDNVPWNVVLSNILEPKDLIIECKEKFFLIKVAGMPEKQPDAPALYTEFIKLKKLPTCAGKGKCEQLSLALHHLKTSVAARLSTKGQVEIDETSQTLIVTDERDNLKALVKLVEQLDNEAFYNEAGKDK